MAPLYNPYMLISDAMDYSEPMDCDGDNNNAQKALVNPYTPMSDNDDGNNAQEALNTLESYLLYTNPKIWITGPALLHQDDLKPLPRLPLRNKLWPAERNFEEPLRKALLGYSVAVARWEHGRERECGSVKGGVPGCEVCCGYCLQKRAKKEELGERHSGRIEWGKWVDFYEDSEEEQQQEDDEEEDDFMDLIDDAKSKFAATDALKKKIQEQGKETWGLEALEEMKRTRDVSKEELEMLIEIDGTGMDDDEGEATGEVGSTTVQPDAVEQVEIATTNTIDLPLQLAVQPAPTENLNTTLQPTTATAITPEDEEAERKDSHKDTIILEAIPACAHGNACPKWESGMDLPGCPQSSFYLQARRMEMFHKRWPDIY